MFVELIVTLFVCKANNNFVSLLSQHQQYLLVNTITLYANEANNDIV